jgi:hypothetical protein
MRRNVSIVALAVGVLLGSGPPARAALLTLTGSSLTFLLPFIDTGCDPFLGCCDPFLGCTPRTNELVFPQRLASVPVSVASAGGNFVLPAGTFTGTEVLPTSLFTGVALIFGATVGNLSNAAAPFTAVGGPIDPGGPFDGAGGGFGGYGALDGTLFINVLGLFNLSVPLDPVGAGGMTQRVAGTLEVTVFGTGWTTGAVAITGITSGNPAVNTVTFAGYDNRTPAHRGTLLLVSPIQVVTNAAGNLVVLARQTLVFEGEVPEPGTLLLLGSGVAGLAWLGHERARRRRRG